MFVESGNEEDEDILVTDLPRVTPDSVRTFPHHHQTRLHPDYPSSGAAPASRADCMRNLQTAIEADSLARLVSQRYDLELMMRQILELERRLSQLTPESPDYTDGKLVQAMIIYRMGKCKSTEAP